LGGAALLAAPSPTRAIRLPPATIRVLSAMFLLGGIARRGYDTRPLVIFGFFLLGAATWQLGSLDLNMSISNFIWPTLVQGIGMGLIFPNLSAAALSSISREQMGYAASIYSMVRNIGGSVGTSVLTTIMVRKQQVEQSYLAEHVSVFDAWRMSQRRAAMPGGMRFDLMGQLATGQKQGLARIYGAVQNQATMISLNQVYRMLSGLILLAILLCLMLPPPRGRAPAGTAH
jgi:DHA2 family multidrug resistance protein